MTQIYAAMGWDFLVEGIAPAPEDEDQPDEPVEHAVVVPASLSESVITEDK
jgi:hypothetical protein